jgi:hypothetical protein
MIVLALALLNGKTCSAAGGLQGKQNVSLTAKLELNSVMTNVCLLSCAPVSPAGPLDARSSNLRTG